MSCPICLSGSSAVRVRSDNGPEFTAKAVQEWIAAVGAETTYTEPVSPWQNVNCEIFKLKPRDELPHAKILASSPR